MTESLDENDFSRYTVDDYIDKISHLTGGFYELRNALKMVGNPALAETMNEFAVNISTYTAKMRYLYHQERKELKK